MFPPGAFPGMPPPPFGPPFGAPPFGVPPFGMPPFGPGMPGFPGAFIDESKYSEVSLNII